jgi:hypothetical protein
MIPTPVAEIALMVKVGPKTFIGIISKLKNIIAIIEISFLVYFIKLEVPKIIKRFVKNRNKPYIEMPKSRFKYKNPKIRLKIMDINGTI